LGIDIGTVVEDFERNLRLPFTLPLVAVSGPSHKIISKENKSTSKIKSVVFFLRMSSAGWSFKITLKKDNKEKLQIPLPNKALKTA